uniref:Retrotransposon gag domain-containing protein n=1 Tax=Vitis vinifera TaxID=29760 RepID=A5BA50_VITVI|nr:hypothetical protein VITISV_016768 [Vitis vinifera]
MLSTPFCSHIINYEPPRGFLVPKFSIYDGTNDPFDHIMHYRQLMTLDIGNDALLCKVFPASLQGQALSWFHHLPPNSVGNFRDLSEAFVGQYLGLAKPYFKWKLAVWMLSYRSSNEASVQALHFSNHWLKSLLLRWTTYSDEPTNIQCSKMTYVQPPNKFWLPDGHPEVIRREIPNLRISQSRLTEGRKGQVARKCRLSPLSISYEKLLPMIQGLSDFKWPRPIATNPSTRDRSKRCAFHKDHGHTTETLIKAGHLKQYLRTDTGGRDVSQHNNPGAPRAPVATKAVINYISGGPSDEEYDSRRKRQKLLRAASIRERINSIRSGLTGEGPRPIDGTIIFPPVDPTRTLQPHRDALILSLEIGDFDVRRILVDPGSSTDLVQASVVGHMGHSLVGLENPGRILSGFNGSSTTSLGDIILPVQAGLVTLNVQFSVVQELSPFNVILGRTWLHYMKAIPSTYHQMVSFLTYDGQIDLYGSQLAARQCYQIACEAGANQEDASPPEPSIAHDQ